MLALITKAITKALADFKRGSRRQSDPDSRKNACIRHSLRSRRKILTKKEDAETFIEAGADVLFTSGTWYCSGIYHGACD